MDWKTIATVGVIVYGAFYLYNDNKLPGIAKK